MKPNNSLLFNGDCSFLFTGIYQENNEERFTRDTLHHFIDLLALNGVDTYLQNPNAQRPWYPSRALSPVWEGYKRGDREFFRGNYPSIDDTFFTEEKLNNCLTENARFLNRYLDLLEDGVDWLKEISHACRRNQISPWVSVRMNDAHGAVNWEKNYMNCDLQKDAHYRLSGRVLGSCSDVSPSQQVLNYEHSEVRAYYFAMIRELVEEYDYEGLELDWLRGPFCCEPPAAKSTLDMMTDWISQIRELTDRKAKKNGSPYVLGLRIPVRLDTMKTIGLDVTALAQNGLIDYIAPSNFWQTTWDVPYKELRSQVGEAVSLYGVIEDAPNWLGCDVSPEFLATGLHFNPLSHRCLSASAELLRGNAAGKLAQSADGIYLYNFFCTDEPLHNPNPEIKQAKYAALSDLHNLSTLRGKSKHYTLSTGADSRMHPFFEFADQLPVTLQAGEQRVFTISMCAETLMLDTTLELCVQIVLKANQHTSPISVSFNGCLPNCDAKITDELVFSTGVFTHHREEHQALNFRFSAQLIKEGWNEVRIFSRDSGNVKNAPARIVSLELAVKPTH